jgi:long-subunit acyl-CoA synthetase (AMP-forming)
VKLRKTTRQLERLDSSDHDPAAIIFTTGSTGPPKGVLYRHGNFANQVSQIRDRYGIQPGEIDLPGFPLFGLFNSAMGVTTVFPEMDFTRPADVDPNFILEHANDWCPTQSFGSPALWNTVGKHCVGRRTRTTACVTTRESRDCGGRRDPHSLRCDRSPADRID